MMARSWRPGDPGYTEAEARWRRQYGHGQPKQAPASKARPGWPEPHPAALSRRLDDAYRDVAAATPAEGTTGQVGGCGHCTRCQNGAPANCKHPDSPAGRAYTADQARAADREAYRRDQLAVEFGLLQLPHA